jgi:hypothetical protein
VRLVDHPLAIRTGVEHCCLEFSERLRAPSGVLKRGG